MAEGELEPLFCSYGDVLEAVIIRDKASGTHKGSAFVKMASLTAADKAIRALHNIKVVDNQLGPIQVKYANGEAERLGLPVENANPGIDVGKLFVGSLPRGVQEQQVRDIFEPFGTIEEIVLLKDAGSGQTKGCAFVKFAYKENAIFAIKTLNGVVSVCLFVCVCWMRRRNFVMRSRTNLFSLCEWLPKSFKSFVFCGSIKNLEISKSF